MEENLGTVTEWGNQDAPGKNSGAEGSWHTSSLRVSPSLGSISRFSFLQEKSPRISHWPQGGRIRAEGGKKSTVPRFRGPPVPRSGARPLPSASTAAERYCSSPWEPSSGMWTVWTSSTVLLRPRVLYGPAKATSPESAQLGLLVPKNPGAARCEKETTSLEGDGPGVLPSLLCAHLGSMKPEN